MWHKTNPYKHLPLGDVSSTVMLVDVYNDAATSFAVDLLNWKILQIDFGQDSTL